MRIGYLLENVCNRKKNEKLLFPNGEDLFPKVDKKIYTLGKLLQLK